MSISYTVNPATLGNVTISSTGSGYSSITSGSTLSYSGTTYNTSWSTPPTGFNSSNGKPILSIPNGEEKMVLNKSATLDVQGNVKINGIDLEERLKTIERLLHIPERDATMEAKYPSLKKKFDDYINTLEKYRTFERIKGEDQ
jgi:hypothetical protein